MGKIIWFVTILLISVTTKAQNFANDCTNAIVICGNENLVSNASGFGNIQEISGCDSYEHNSLWIKINMVKQWLKIKIKIIKGPTSEIF